MKVCFQLWISIPNEDPAPGRMPRAQHTVLRKCFDLPFCPPDGLELDDPAAGKDITFVVKRTVLCTGQPKPLLLSHLAPIDLGSKDDANQFQQGCEFHGWHEPGAPEESG